MKISLDMKVLLDKDGVVEHWVSRDAVPLMAKPIFLPSVNEIESGVYLLYDGACGASSGPSHLKQDGNDASPFSPRQVTSP